MAASLSLNDPVVIVTLVSACAAPTGCTAIATNKINGMEKLESFIFIASSDDLAMWNAPTLMKSLNAVKPELRANRRTAYLIVFPKKSEQRRELPAQLRRSSAP